MISCFSSLAIIATASHGEQSLTILLVQIVLLVVFGRLFGEIMQRVGQPAVLGQLLAGVLLGPSVFGTVWPSAQHFVFTSDAGSKQMLTAVSELGVLMLLLLTGMETNLALVKRVKRTAAFTSTAGILIPFVCGYLLGEFLPETVIPDPNRRFVTSLFLATALSISSVKIVAVVLREVDFLRRNLGQVILASAILDDTLGWILLSFIGGIASHGTIEIRSLLVSVLGTALFLFVSFTVGKHWVARLIRWTNDVFTIEMPVISLILVIMILMSLLTTAIGVHTVLGAFVAGILIGQSPILTDHIEEQLRGLIVAFFMPVFFGVAGLSIDLKVLADPHLLEIAVLLIIIASIGKLGGCYLGSRLSGMHHSESLAVGLGMNARGSTEVILATIGLGIGVLNQELFTIIVIMAITTTLCMPPLLRWALEHVPIGDEEKDRLESEEAEEHSILSKIERLLIGLNIDGRDDFTARIAGWFVGTRQIITSVMELNAPDLDKPETHPSPHILMEAVTFASETVARKQKAKQAKQNGENNPVNISPEAETMPVKELVSVLKPKQKSESEASDTLAPLLEEAKNGYGMIFLGVKITSELRDQVDDILRAFSGPTAILFEPAQFRNNQKSALKKILVPAIGTDYSHFGAEVAVAIAKGCGAHLTALHVSVRTDANLRHPAELLRTGRALIDDIAKLGKREGVRVQSKLLTGKGHEGSILRQAKNGAYHLLVIGTKTHAGEKLNFGDSVMVMIEKSPCPVLVVNL